MTGGVRAWVSQEKKKRNKHLREITVRVPAHRAIECYEIASGSPVVRYPPQRRMLQFGAEGVSSILQSHFSRRPALFASGHLEVGLR